MKIRILLLATMLMTSTILKPEEFKVDGIYYRNWSGNTVSVWSSPFSSDYSGVITIPETVEYNGKTYTVDKIGGVAFQGCNFLESVVIPKTVTTIESGAFELSSLEYIEIPNTVTEIGRAFERCWKIKEPLYNDKIFAYLPFTITEYEIPKGIETIAPGAFSNGYITTVKLPSTLKTIGVGAFSECGYLTSIEIPNSVTTIDISAFSMSGLQKVVIPDNVKSIGISAFKYCPLKTVVLGRSLEYIGIDAFNYCSDIKEVISLNPIPPAPKEYVKDQFDNIAVRHAVLYVPDGFEDVYKDADIWKDFWKIKGGAEAAGISGIKGSGESCEGKTYNLQGQPVNDAFKGIVIQNGRKMLRK